MESQPADSGNRTATIELIARISLQLQIKQIYPSFNHSNKLVEVCQFPLPVNKGKPIATTNYRTGFQQEMQETFSTMNMKGLYAISSSEQEPHVYS